MRKIVDLCEMPQYNTSVLNGAKSVSEGKVFIKILPFGEYPYCKEHGAMNKVDTKGIWRCLTCNEGCYEQ